MITSLKSSGGSTLTFNDVVVRLDGKKVGEIRHVDSQWKYFPKGDKVGGEPFPTLEACQRSLQ